MKLLANGQLSQGINFAHTPTEPKPGFQFKNGCAAKVDRALLQTCHQLHNSLIGRALCVSDLNDLPTLKRLQLDSPSTLSNSLNPHKHLTENELRSFLRIFKCPESSVMPLLMVTTAHFGFCLRVSERLAEGWCCSPRRGVEASAPALGQ